MSRRRESGEIVFGSDSFLDILANVVGILIILIVIAGVRVSQSPATAASQTTDTVAVASIMPVPGHQLDVTPLPPVPVIAAPDNPLPISEPPELSPELVSRVNELESTIEELEGRQRQLVSEEHNLTTEASHILHALSASQQQLETKQATLTRGSQTISALDISLEETHSELATLQLILAETEAAQPQATVLKHKLTPVGREVQGDELHFLLTRGRVSVVPINDLADELKSQLQRKKHQLLKTQRYAGSIGPIRGFKMEYVIERQLSSLIDELRYGASIIRMGVSQWRIVPQSHVIAETTTQAIHPHGRFLSALRQADPDVTLTFWVHPDSFGLHRDLQEFVHEQGFEVAARPLPTGIPITGSPQGSRSVVQ